MDEAYTKDSLFKELQRVARALGRERVSQREFVRESGISQRQILRHFKTWNELVLESSIKQIDKSRIDDETLLENTAPDFAIGRDEDVACGSNRR